MSYTFLLRGPKALPVKVPGIGLWAACLLAAGWVSLSSYVAWTLQGLVLGIMAIAATSRKDGKAGGRRYAVAALLMLCMSLLVPVKTFLFFGFAFTVFYGLEYSGIGLPFLSWASLVLSSPLFEYGMTAFSFPIRLRLASLTGKLFAALNSGVEVKANVILFGGEEFSVDPACMGLHMLSVSLLLGIIFLGLLQKKTGLRLAWNWVLLYIFSIFIFNILSNLLRIILLVQFRIPAGSFLHDAMGLVCLLVYVCLPSALLAKRLLLEKGGMLSTAATPSNPSKLLPWLLLAALTGAVVRVRTADTYGDFQTAGTKTIPGYRSSWSVPGVLKLQSSGSLIYVKFIRGFYDTEHNPSMCWAGSGYSFEEAKEETVEGGRIFTTGLVRGREKLFTAWWYSNGSNAITDQWQWRWDLLRGEKGYAVINVTAQDRASLQKEVARLLKDRALQPLIHP